jgi:hypothetical protein
VRVEVITMLGSTCVERVVVRDRVAGYDIVENGTMLRRGNIEHQLPVHLPYGLGELIVSPVARPTNNLPRPPVSSRAIGFLGASFAAHLAILTAALLTPLPNKPPPRSRGASRPRLVANHTTQTRAKRDTDVVESVHEQDTPAQHPIAEPVPPGKTKLAPIEPDPGPDLANQKPTEAARHFDPCADGDCGLIATSRFDTVTQGRQAGDSYQLPERHTLSMSVEECSVESGCTTVSGSDQDDIRTAIGRHVGEVNACFHSHPAASASVDATVEAAGTVRVAAHDETSSCIAAVIAKLKLPGGERDVTLAFTSPS